MLKELWDWIKTFAIAIVLVVVLRMFFFDNYVVFGQSMEPNFFHEERLIVNKIIYDIREPKRGEVIVLHASEGEDYIKRVIGLPGETVRVQGDDVYINGSKIEEDYLAEAVRKAVETGGRYNMIDYPQGSGEVKIPNDAVFVLGDNRSYSKDSRDPMVGFIDMQDIVGRADVIYWPLQSIAFRP